MNDLSIRTMRPDEISIAVNWAAAEGWNPGLADDACFAAVDPEGFLIGELDGAPAATVSCVNHSASFAFLGFYIVREDFRDLGLVPVLETARMYTGAILPLRLDRVFGVTTFELG